MPLIDLRKTSGSPGSFSSDSEVILSDGSDTLVSATAEKGVLDTGGESGSSGILRKSSLRELSLNNFRNYHSLDFEFSAPITVIIGQNGRGKTNLIEAIYLTSLSKSWRTKDQNLIGEGGQGYKVQADWVEHKISVEYHPDTRKVIKRSGIEIKPGQLVGLSPLVLFEPSSLNLFIMGPSYRRGYLDQTLCQISSHYLVKLNKYNKVMRQRNQALKQQLSQDLIFAYNLQLVEYGWFIYEQRTRLIDYYNQNLSHWYQEISGQKEDIAIDYLSNLGSDPDQYLLNLEKSFSKDIVRQSTSIGIHHDDILVKIDDQEVRDYASRGESRTVVLAMKQVELIYIEEVLGKNAILLLDDVVSELDYLRRKQLVAMLGKQQSIITTTEAISDLPDSSTVFSL
ncbi:DNA replication/repair protein RecF [Candidatus Saccharibacteria bacterium]|nr:DNA replication/repair protein RecF [Candidatus Saccharibacteria bacterium]MCB9834582.1 DNA replication/repair protein RecF [Candidatus Nomurabacteria bacterium]